MKIFLATDHTGLELKNKVKDFLQEKGYNVSDCGAYEFNKDDDYPDYISKAAIAVAKDPNNNRGIIFGGSGQGEAMVANKIKGIRCAVFYGKAVPIQAVDAEGQTSDDPFMSLRLTRQHNDANILSLGARFLTDEDALQAITIWLHAPSPQEERHKRRIEKMRKIEEME